MSSPEPDVFTSAGARHEVFNETNSEEVVTDLLGWLDRTAAT